MTAILPPLPIVGKLKLTSFDGKTLSKIEVTSGKSDKQLSPFFESCFRELEVFLTGKKKNINIKLDYSGLTDFQRKVLKKMKAIPYGGVASYKDLGMSMKSRAFQAIGGACGRNPFMLIYPCHRIVGANDLGGFAHGLPMKKALLKLENDHLKTE